MTGELDVLRGSGNVFRDFGCANAEIWQVKAELAAKISGVLDDRGLTVRQAETATGIAAADFSRIRRARLERFTIDRLMTTLARLDQKVEITIPGSTGRSRSPSQARPEGRDHHQSAASGQGEPRGG